MRAAAHRSGRRSLRSALAVAALLLAVQAGSPRTAHAVPACTAEDIVNADPSCPAGTGTCTISRPFEIGDGCEVDFSGRDVIMAANSVLDAGDGSISFVARSLIMQPRSTIFGRGDLGPSVCILTEMDLVVERGVGRAVIDTSGADLAGCLALTVGGNLTVNGELISSQTSAGGSGGEIIVTVDGSMVTGPQSAITAIGTGQESSGGNVDISVLGNATFNGPITTTGGEGGSVVITGEMNVTTAVIDARSNRGANDGGSVDVIGGKAVTLNGNINVNASGPDELFGATGGSVTVEGLFGDVTVNARVNSDGSSPDGSGGDFFMEAEGNFITAGNAILSATTLGIEGCGGVMELNGGIDLIHSGSIALSGGIDGGALTAFADRRAIFTGSVDTKGRDAGSFGGPIEIEAGPNPASLLQVSGLLDAQGGRCSFDLGCGGGGSIDLTACNVSVLTGARLFSFAPDGGFINFVGRKGVNIAGRVDATTTAPSQGGNGEIEIEHPIGSPPVLTGSTITPPASLVARTVCMQPGQTMCLRPCPTCGNGVVEFPESCDRGAPTPVNCANGCSSSCQVQVCQDTRICTADLCDPVLGCFFEPIPSCTEPTSTPTISRTPTVTQTPTITATQTITGTPTLSGTPTDTPTVTPTPLNSSTPSMSPTFPQPATPTPTDTPSVGRPGDANCDNQVNAADRVALNAALFESTQCPGADVNRDGVITAADPAAFIRNDPR